MTAVVDPFAHLGWLTAVLPFSTSYRAFWMALGVISSDLVVAIVATSLLRRLFGHGTWRAVHWLAYAAWPVALLHGIGTGTDAASDWMVVVDFFSAGIVGVAVAGRLLSPRPNRLAADRERFRASVQREVPR